MNELVAVARAFSAAAIPNSKEPQGLCRSDGKRPDGLTLVPWQSGRALVWDVTVVCPLADSYVASAAREARSVAELAATKKEDKYSGLAADYLFQPIAVEILGPINESAYDFLSLLAKKISQHSGDERETAFCSSAFPRSCSDITAFCCTILLFGRTTRSNGHSYNFLFFIIFFQNPSGSLIPRVKK